MANKNQAPAYPGQNRNPSKDSKPVQGLSLDGFSCWKRYRLIISFQNLLRDLRRSGYKELTKFIYQEYYLNPRKTWKLLEEYLHFYNYERIPLGKYLNGMISIEKLNYYLSTVSSLKIN